MVQLLQLVGAVMVLAAFALLQFHVVHPRSSSYLLLNLVGAGRS
ncbi:MAG: CBU_0592 family membrane protein [Gaiellaceae bacterium]